LKFGDRGQDVVEFNKALAAITIDGRPLRDDVNIDRYDETTKYAVTRLQKHAHITEDGIAGAKTHEALARLTAQQSAAEAPDTILVTAGAKDALPEVSAPALAQTMKPKLPTQLLGANNLGINVPLITYDKKTLDVLGKHSVAIQMAQSLHASDGLGNAPLRSPYESGTATITSMPGARGSGHHAGMDSVGKNNRLVSPVDGVLVACEGKVAGDGVGFGISVVVYSVNEDGKKLQHRLAHLEEGSVPANLRQGPVVVRAGEFVGLEGDTGRVRLRHSPSVLHYEVRESKAARPDEKDDFNRIVSPGTLLAHQGNTLLAYRGSAEPVRGAQASMETAKAQVASVVLASVLSDVAKPLSDEPLQPIKLASLDVSEHGAAPVSRNAAGAVSSHAKR